MGVIYKLKDEVVQFIISQRRSNPHVSCRELAESSSQKFNLRLSKSSVHDVLKEAGIVSARGRKPKDKFKIPLEKKHQIQKSLSQIKLLPDPLKAQPTTPNVPALILPGKTNQASQSIIMMPDLTAMRDGERNMDRPKAPMKYSPEDEWAVCAEYPNAGKVFLKAVRWDLGIFHEQDISMLEWKYYQTYSKGVRIILEEEKSLFIELLLPIERCIREVADGLVNNVRAFIVSKVSDESLFKACMEGQQGHKIQKISIVGQNDHEIIDFTYIVDFKRTFFVEERLFVDSKLIDEQERLATLFFANNMENRLIIDNLLGLKGFESVNRAERIVTLVSDGINDCRPIAQEAASRFNAMFLRDEEGRLVKVKI